MGINRKPGTEEYERWYFKRYGRAACSKIGTCIVCGRSFVGHANKKYCSKRCKDILCRGRREKRLQKAERSTDVKIKIVYERDSGTCYICGRKCDFNDWRPGKERNWTAGETYPTIDHVIPISKGGKDTLDNVRLACWKCNMSKGNKVITA